MYNKKEIRIYNVNQDQYKARAIENEETKTPQIQFYASVFNQKSKLLPRLNVMSNKIERFNEIILPGSFTNIINERQDVIVNYQHQDSLLLGRIASNTLSLNQDNYGLLATVNVNTEDREAMNVYARVKRGDLYESSFAFGYIEEEKDYTEERDEDGNILITVRNFPNVYDVAIVTRGAYANTKIDFRNLNDEEIEEKVKEITINSKKSNDDIYRNKTTVLKLKYNLK